MELAGLNPKNADGKAAGLCLILKESLILIDRNNNRELFLQHRDLTRLDASD